MQSPSGRRNREGGQWKRHSLSLSHFSFRNSGDLASPQHICWHRRLYKEIPQGMALHSAAHPLFQGERLCSSPSHPTISCFQGEELCAPVQNVAQGCLQASFPRVAERGEKTPLFSFGLHVTAALKKQRAGPVQALYVIFSSEKAKRLQKGFFI